MCRYITKLNIPDINRIHRFSLQRNFFFRWTRHHQKRPQWGFLCRNIMELSCKNILTSRIWPLRNFSKNKYSEDLWKSKVFVLFDCCLDDRRNEQNQHYTSWDIFVISVKIKQNRLESILRKCPDRQMKFVSSKTWSVTNKYCERISNIDWLVDWLNSF